MKPPKDPGYPVGYGKPPPHTQFKPGQSGNPNGRPKGAVSLATIVKRALMEQITVTGRGGRVKTMSILEAGLRRLSHTGAKGDVRAMQLMLQLAPLLDEAETGTKATLGADDAAILARLIQRGRKGSSDPNSDN